MTPLTTWQNLGRKAAVVAGASTALVSLLVHNTLLTATLRGGIALFAVLLVVRAGSFVLSRTPATAKVKARTTTASKARTG